MKGVKGVEVRNSDWMEMKGQGKGLRVKGIKMAVVRTVDEEHEWAGVGIQDEEYERAEVRTRDEGCEGTRIESMGEGVGVGTA